MSSGSWSLNFIDATGDSSSQSVRRGTIPAVLENGFETSEGSSEAKAGWEEIIDTLSTWADDVSVLEDDGVIPPSYPIIRKALSLSHTLMARGWAAPLRVVPNAEGGVVFERKDKDFFEEIELEQEGTAEIRIYQDFKIIIRQPFTL